MRPSFAYPSLYIHADRLADRLWLVHRTDGHALVGDRRYERLNQDEAEHMVRRAHLDQREVERFLSRAAGEHALFDFAQIDRGFVGMTRIGVLVERGVLVAFRQRGEDELDPARKAVREEREIVRAFVQLQRKIDLVPGRRCVLVSGADYATVPNRDHFQVVARSEAVTILSTATARATLPAPERALLTRAASLLAANWRPPALPQGLVLLRELVRHVATQRTEPALTPSQIRAMMAAEESVTLEVVVLGLDEQPLKDIKFIIEAPDDETHEGDLGASGKTKVVSAKRGTATVTLDWADLEEGAAAQTSG
jgi:hypothetical protein